MIKDKSVIIVKNSPELGCAPMVQNTRKTHHNNPQTVAKIIFLYKNGKSLTHIAEILGIKSHATVSNILRRNDIEMRTTTGYVEKHTLNITNPDKIFRFIETSIIRMHLEMGMSTTEISKSLIGFAENDIYEILCSHNINPNTPIKVADEKPVASPTTLEIKMTSFESYVIQAWDKKDWENISKSHKIKMVADQAGRSVERIKEILQKFEYIK